MHSAFESRFRAGGGRGLRLRRGLGGSRGDLALRGGGGSGLGGNLDRIAVVVDDA